MSYSYHDKDDDDDDDDNDGAFLEALSLKKFIFMEHSLYHGKHMSRQVMSNVAFALRYRNPTIELCRHCSENMRQSLVMSYFRKNKILSFYELISVLL